MVNLDKLYHIIAALVLFALGGLTLVIIGAIVKDVAWDLLLKKGTFDPMDIIATVVPALVLEHYHVPNIIGYLL